MAAHGVEASNPLSITKVIIILRSGKHCIVCVPHSCSDFLVVSICLGRALVDWQAIATLRSVLWVILVSGLALRSAHPPSFQYAALNILGVR